MVQDSIISVSQMRKHRLRLVVSTRKARKLKQGHGFGTCALKGKTELFLVCFYYVTFLPW